MNFIVAMLLQHVDDEEDTFWCLIYIMFELNWREIFDSNSSKIIDLLAEMNVLLEKNHAAVHAHM